MPKPTLRDRLQFLSVTDVARELGLTISQVDLRIKQGIFPPPTAVKRSGLRLFNSFWLDAARAQLQQNNRKESIGLKDN